MKPFDLEAAKRGEPIFDEVTGLVVHFVGVTKNANFVIELNNSIYRRNELELRMAPKKRTVWVNLYHVFYTEEDADAADTISNDHRIGGKAYPVEIEE
jgi:hypothetical protein